MAKSIRLTGIKEALVNTKALGKMFDSNKLYGVLGEAARPLLAQARANVAHLSMNVSNAVKLGDKIPANIRKRKRVAVFLQKSEVMREWKAGRGNTSPRAKVATGGKVAESLGTMLELGTSRRYKAGVGMMAYHWFRSAADQTKALVRSKVKSGLEQVTADTIAQFVKSPGKG
jgi:hypothetical protein